MAAPTRVSFPSFNLNIVGELHGPAPGSPSRHGAAIIISHPMTGVKEQTSTTYAHALSQAGFYALTFDAAYQGESSGEPRGLENPIQRVEDIKSAATYLSTMNNGEIDAEKIGLLGICASGGYASYAAQSDVRIKAVATVSGACTGRMTRSGGIHAHLKENDEVIAATLKAAADWRNKRAKSDTPLQAPKVMDSDPSTITPDMDAFTVAGKQYYGTSRGNHPRSDQRIQPDSFDMLLNYDSFNFQHLISPRPLLMIAGENAETRHYSEWAVGHAREPKKLMVVKGKNHLDLYDDLTETGPELAAFFGQYL